MRKHELIEENKRLRQERNDLSKQSVEQEIDLMRLGLIPDEYIIALAFGSRYVNWSKIREDRKALETYEAAERGRKLAGDAERITQTAADIDRLIEHVRRAKPRKPWLDAKPGEIWALETDQHPEPRAFKASNRANYATSNFTQVHNGQPIYPMYEQITAGRRIWPAEIGETE